MESSRNTQRTSQRIVQITDCHLGASDSESLLGMNTQQGLSDVLALIAASEPEAERLLATGDLSNDHSVGSYERFLTSVSGQMQCPVHCLPGNHDHWQNMAQVLGTERMAQQVDLGPWQILMLNSQVLGKEHGDLADTELAFLQERLTSLQNKFVMICLHHQVVPVGSAWIDQYVVRSAARFFDVLSGFNNVKAVSWGHVHQLFDQQHNDVRLLATPSTCIQFKPGIDEFTVDDVMPGYRWFELYDDGHLETGIKRIASRDYGIDYGSSGY